jgi:hypothetical protein
MTTAFRVSAFSFLLSRVFRFFSFHSLSFSHSLSLFYFHLCSLRRLFLFYLPCRSSHFAPLCFLSPQGMQAALSLLCVLVAGAFCFSCSCLIRVWQRLLCGVSGVPSLPFSFPPLLFLLCGLHARRRNPLCRPSRLWQWPLLLHNFPVRFPAFCISLLPVPTLRIVFEAGASHLVKGCLFAGCWLLAHSIQSEES